MNETDYNARLYEKMKAEQDKYRDWLLHQEPSEILNHTYEYTMREDIVMCMEELELEPEKARAFIGNDAELLRNTPLSRSIHLYGSVIQLSVYLYSNIQALDNKAPI